MNLTEKLEELKKIAGNGALINSVSNVEAQFQCDPKVALAFMEAVEAMEFCQVIIDHALHLGYLGEGSTNGMAKDASSKAEGALANLSKALGCEK